MPKIIFQPLMIANPAVRNREGVSLFIGFRGVIGTFLLHGLLTDLKRKLDLTVVAIPPKAGEHRDS